MTPALLHLYQELAKIGAYFIRYPNDCKLQLIVKQNSMISNIFEFGVPEVQRQHLFHLFGPQDLQSSQSQTELLLRQLPVLQYRGKVSHGDYPEV
jgi:hypothetical protein